MTTTFAYKDLVIDFTSSFQLMWTDEGSRGERDGAFWRPLTNTPRLQNFYPVGDLGWPNRDDVNGKTAIAVLKDSKGDAGTALRRPLRFEKVWTDQGSGSWKNGSMWRPIPPDGYVALGLVCNVEYDPPSVDTYRCVRSDLVHPAAPGDLIWDDKGTNAWYDFSSWRINPPDAPGGMIYLSPGTFVGAASHTPTARDANAYALMLLIPEETNTPEPPAPVLRSFSRPAKVGKDTLTYTTILPWFTVNDPNLTPLEQIMTSSEYRLKRVDRFKCFGFGWNNTSGTQRFSWAYEEGNDGSKTKEFSETTGIEFTVTWKSTAWEVSAKLSQSFTHTESETDGWSKKTTRTVDVEIPPGKAIAAYTIESTYTLFRGDANESQVTTVGVDYEGGGNVYWVEYPPKTATKTSAAKQAAPKTISAKPPAAKPLPAKQPAVKPLPAKQPAAKPPAKPLPAKPAGAKPLPAKPPAAKPLPAKKAVPAKGSNSR
ncbi:MAG TPA: Vps62-related protein [Pyrinomonadaceae bacterium]|nr:Vps62-related protein [Pyrinomonadaceae bacterium]